MAQSGRFLPVIMAGCALLAALFVGTVLATVPTTYDASQLLMRADKIKTGNYAEFTALMRRLDESRTALPPEQRLYLRYLDAWQTAYHGDYTTAIPELQAVIDESKDATLRFRAGLVEVNLLGIAARYEQAFAKLSQLLDQLPQIKAKDARALAMNNAALLYNEAGQYDLGIRYAAQLIRENPTDENICKGGYFELDALYKSNKLPADSIKFQHGIDACVKAGEVLFANAIRADVASFDIQQGRATAANRLLVKNYPAVERLHYARLISQFDALLAEANWAEGKIPAAQQFARDALQSSVKNEYTEPLIIAYKLLYQISQKQGDFQTALAFHERYMAADKGYLDEVSAKALAYQTVKQQVLAKKLQIDALDKQNRILQLQRALDKKAIETTRLYIILLLTVLAFIAFVTYRIKRSQLRFMRMARRDGLTGLFNRQHFLDEAQRQLQYCRKSARDACLVLIDLDHFKNINDTHGHVVGDEVLKRAVVACQAHLRSTDIFGRLGGEEFGILLPECSLERVNERVERLRLAVAEIPASDDLCVPVSASFGVATTVFSGYELRQLLIHADDALYQAKNSGRNRAVVFNDTDDVPQDGMRKSRRGTPMVEPVA